jgi:alcohol dehydrogenase class IV
MFARPVQSRLGIITTNHLTRRAFSTMESSNNPLAGLWKPNPLKGKSGRTMCVWRRLMSSQHSTMARRSWKTTCLNAFLMKTPRYADTTPEFPIPRVPFNWPAWAKRRHQAFIITGASLATKTPLIKQVEGLLGAKHAGTFSNIKQHAPVAQLDEATDLVAKDSSIDTLISVGGGSPIDSAKAISFRQNEKTGHFLHHIAIPTTLSAAECTSIAGYTKADGVKTGIGHPSVYPSAILYDPAFGAHTPKDLWLSTAIRSLDHAVELLYHPTATQVPCKQLALQAISALFTHLPTSHASHPNDPQTITQLFLAAFASLAFLGQNMKGGLGLSHSMGYALGSPYGIPHGVTSCLTLGHVMKLKANSSKDDAAQIARILPFIGQSRSGDDVADANKAGDAVLDLVQRLGLKTTLTEKGVGEDQIDIIAKRATGGQTEGPVYEAVKKLTRDLY